MQNQLDENKMVEVALALLSLTLHDGNRVWKGLDWDLLDKLHGRGWISNPQSKAKSVVLSEEGVKLAQKFLVKYFGQED